MGGGVGFEDKERAGDKEVERCLSVFAGCCGCVETFGAIVFSFAFLFEPLLLAVDSSGATVELTSDDDFALLLVVFSLASDSVLATTGTPLPTPSKKIPNF